MMRSLRRDQQGNRHGAYSSVDILVNRCDLSMDKNVWKTHLLKKETKMPEVCQFLS